MGRSVASDVAHVIGRVRGTDPIAASSERSSGWIGAVDAAATPDDATRVAGVSESWPWAEHFGAEGTYLATATCGLPPRRTSERMTAVLDAWRRGAVSAAQFDATVTAARAGYARLVGVDPAQVAIGHQVSPLVGIVAASLPVGTTVLLAEEEFTSVSFPFAAQEPRGIRLKVAPLAELAEHVTSEVGLVAVSAVQSADGRLADLDAISAAADVVGADVLVDLTQAAGWLPVDAARFAYTVCGTYKWLLSPRGTAFLTVRPDRLDALVPAHAGWYAGQDPWASIYGLPLRLATDARRFDVSPAWFAWEGTSSSIDFLTSVGTRALHEHAVGLEAAFAESAGLEPNGSAIRSLRADPDVADILDAASVTASVRAGRLRLAFHVNNTRAEAEHVGALLRGRVHD